MHESNIATAWQKKHEPNNNFSNKNGDNWNWTTKNFKSYLAKRHNNCKYHWSKMCNRIKDEQLPNSRTNREYYAVNDEFWVLKCKWKKREKNQTKTIILNELETKKFALSLHYFSSVRAQNNEQLLINQSSTEAKIILQIQK